MSENFAANLPKKFARNATDLCGEIGEQWLNDLPRIIAEIESNWSLKTGEPFRNLSYNFVAPCVYNDGGEAVLKIALPLNNPEIFNEAEYLRLANGDNAVQLLNADESRRAILLEHLAPGKNLKEIFRGDESQTTEVMIKILRRLIKKTPKDFGFRQLDEWFNNFFRKAPQTNFPVKFQTKAREFYERLSSAPENQFLIHGDLHHENILSATREPFLAIDPKGIVGDVGYEIAVFLNNHLWWLSSDADLKEKLNDAVRRFSDSFEIAPNDLRQWAFAQISLSAWWTFDENGENWEKELAFAEFWEV